MKKLKKIANRILTVVLVVSLLGGLSAYANTRYFRMTDWARGTGYTFFEDGSMIKDTSTGSNASVTVTENANGASMYYCVLKTDGVPASTYKNTTSTGTFSLAYGTETNSDVSLGRNGYTYYFRVAHRSQSSQTTATVAGSCTP